MRLRSQYSLQGSGQGQAAGHRVFTRGSRGEVRVQGLLASPGAKGQEVDRASSGGLPQPGQHWAGVELNTEQGDGVCPRGPPHSPPTAEQGTAQATARQQAGQKEGAAGSLGGCGLPTATSSLMLHFHMIHRPGFTVKDAFK